MIDSFITQTIEQNDTSYLNKMPSFLLNETEKKLFEFVISYVEKHKKTPTRERLQKEGYGHYLTTAFKDTPLSDLFEMTLDIKRNEYFLRKSGELQIEMDKDGKIDTNKLAKLYSDLSVTYVGKTVDFTDYKRERFYSTEKPDAVLFGWETIDKPTGGILPGEYAILVARLGVGKSLIAVYEAIQWAKQGKKVLFVPCEMTIDQTIFRMDAFLGGFNPLVFRTKQPYGSTDTVEEKEVQCMLDTYYELVNMELDNIRKHGGKIVFPERNVKNIRQVKSLMKETNADITIIDALYLMGNSDGIVSSDWKILKEISNEIKSFCISENQRVFCTTQLKRTGGKEMEFTTEDIAYSDAFAQDADLVMAMYKVPAKPKQVVLDLLKVRHGSDLGGIELEVDWKNMRLNTVETKLPEFEDIEEGFKERV